MKIYIDIETVPTQRSDVIKKITSTVKPPGNISKQETIDKWLSESAPAAIAEALHKTGLSGTFGEIICISWAIEDAPVQTVNRRIDESESEMLRTFLASIRALDVAGRPASIIWVGHRVADFDLRFIFQRAIVNGLLPPHSIMPNYNAWSPQIYDTSYEWAGRDGVKLDNLCLALGVKTKGDLDGSKVWDYAKQGRYAEIVDYCSADVERVRHVYKKMHGDPN